MPGPSPEGGAYQRQEMLPVAPEQAPKPAELERQPNSAERGETQQHVPTEPALTAALPAQSFLPAPTEPVSQVVQASDDSNPLVAGDDDLIEKEWVDKAKKIIQETRSDPYIQEREVSKLQADYMKKRYGKDVKIANE